MQTSVSSGNTFLLCFSALTTGWIGFLGYRTFRKAKPASEAEPVSEVEQARSLVISRYGKSFDRQDHATGEWWIVSESGMILGHGISSEDAWIRSAFMSGIPHHTSLPD